MLEIEHQHDGESLYYTAGEAVDRYGFRALARMMAGTHPQLRAYFTDGRGRRLARIRLVDTRPHAGEPDHA